MIASVSGTIAAKGDRFLIVTAGGIGFRVFVTPLTLRAHKVGMDATFFTYHHVSENAMDLFGFSTVEETAFFELLLTVSGIGPKTALNVMSIATMSELAEAIGKSDATLLTKVSGIGRKTAERVVLELQEKVPGAGETEGTLKDDVSVIDALVSLGYTRSEARTAVRKLPASISGISDRVREALKHIGRHDE